MDRENDSGLGRMRRMILLRVLLAPFLVLMLVCTTLVYYFATYSRDQVEEKLRQSAEAHGRLIEEFLVERASDMRFASYSGSLSEYNDEKKLADLFRELQYKSEAFFDLGVFNEKGKHVAYIGPFDLAGKDYSNEPWFKAVQESRIYISDVFLGYRNYPHFIVAVRNEGPEGPWYLRATIDTVFFNELVESVRIGKTGEAYLVNSAGVLQTRPRSGGKIMDSAPDFEQYLTVENGVTSFAAGDYPGGRYVYATSNLDSTSWMLVVRQQALDAYIPLGKAVLLSVGIIVGGGAIVVVLAYLLASGLSGRLIMADMEKRQMKTQLIVAGKLAEIGEMSSGLAHEINNPLQVMKAEQMLIQDLLGDLETKEQDAGTITHIMDSVNQLSIQIERCGKITQGLLSFARKNEDSPEQIELQTFLPEVVGMVEHRAQLENIRLVQELAPELPPITGDQTQLQQVFLNLVNNAISAIEEKGRGEIRIKAERKNGNVAVSIMDNGPGIPPENMEKIFLPFFTTKPPGKGTGLGLSTAYGIVKGMGGEITVTSELDRGTVFTVLLPSSSKSQKKTGQRPGGEEERKNGGDAAFTG